MNSFTLLLAILLVSTPLHSFCQWTDDSLTNTKIKDANGTDEVTPLSVTTTDGLTYISWFESAAGGYTMKMQLLDGMGNKLWDTDGLLISDHPQESALFVYDLAVDHDNNAIVAFQDIRNGNLQPVIYKIDQDGNFLWGADGIVLHDPVADFELAPSIGVLTNNDVFIAWNASSGNFAWVPFVKISADGSLPGNLMQIKSATSSPDYTRPDFVANSDGSFIMTYIEQTGNFPGLTSIIFAQHYDSDGLPLWTNPTQVSSYSISFVAYPLITSDGQGGIFIEFGSGTPGNQFINDVFVQHLDASGFPLFDPDGFEVASLPGYHKFPSDVYYLTSSEELWVLMKVTDGSQGMAGVYAQKLDAAGNQLLGADGVEVLPLSSTEYHEPFGWGNSDDGVIIVYSEGGVVSQKLKAIKIDYTGSSVWNSGSVTMSAVNSNKYDITTGDFANDQLVAIWYDQRNGGGVYAQNVNDDGTLGLNATGNFSLSTESPFSFFPTLINDRAYVNIGTDQGPVGIKLFSVDNKLLMEMPLTEPVNEINFSCLRPGIYLFVIQSGEMIAKGKMVKQ